MKVLKEGGPRVFEKDPETEGVVYSMLLDL